MLFSDPDFDSDFGADVLLPVASESQNIAGDYRSTDFLQPPTCAVQIT